MPQRAVAGGPVITGPWTAIMSLISERRELGGYSPASVLLYRDVYGIMGHAGLPTQAAMTALLPWGAAATMLRSQPCPCIHT